MFDMDMSMRSDAINGSTYYNRYQHQGDGKHSKLDTAAKELQHQHNCCKQANSYDLFCFAIHF